ncbi:MAG: DNA mismatch repair endonuclease MutL [Eubacteriales bacterium]
MGIINVLDKSVANLIAAGEVVERPASAIKEMVENSLDAGATEITTEIKNGGISFLRVTDNGCGMTRDDAMMCLRRHATSKIKNAKDLYAIMTLGFRGEALAAISAVTKMRIMTAKKDEAIGTLVTSNYGELLDVAESGCPSGTTIICEAMFATTPARLKFMKSNASETAYVASVMEKMAISRPDVAFRFIADGKQRFFTSGDGNLKNAIYSVYGAFASKLIEVSFSGGGIKVKGYISSPDNVRGNRAMQHFFINSRAVRNKTLTAALEQAFRSYIPSDKFPSCVLDICLAHSLVDVNIHPSKLEVKFSDEKTVFDAVYCAVRGALDSSISHPSIENAKEKSGLTEEKLKVISAFVPKDDREKYEPVKIFDTLQEARSTTAVGVEKESKSASELPKRSIIDISCDDEDTGSADYIRKKDISPLKVSAGMSLVPEKDTSQEKIKPSEVENDDMSRILYSADKKTEDNSEPPMPHIPAKDANIPGKTANKIPEYTIIGELYSTYVIMQLEDRVLLVDKHAAHERINFEILRAGMAKIKPDTQILISPETMLLSNEAASLACEFQNEITACGFIFEIKDGRTAYISGIPSGYGAPEARDMFETLVTSLSDYGGNIEFQRKSMFESALYQTACKASVKAGRVYDEALIRYICDNLLRYDCIKYCPHGRPVAFEITRRELDRRFGRIK